MEVIRILAHCRKKIGTAEVAFTGVTDIQRVNEGAVVNRGNSIDRGNKGYGIIGNERNRGKVTGKTGVILCNSVAG